MGPRRRRARKRCFSGLLSLIATPLLLGLAALTVVDPPGDLPVHSALPLTDPLLAPSSWAGNPVAGDLQVPAEQDPALPGPHALPGAPAEYPLLAPRSR